MLHNCRDRRIWSGSGSLLEKLSSQDLFTKLFWAGVRSAFPKNSKWGQQSYQRVQNWNWNPELGENFYPPIYDIGQTVLQCIKVRQQSEILRPVLVTGLSWTNFDWQYKVSPLKNHPDFEIEEYESCWLDEWQLKNLEAI